MDSCGSIFCHSFTFRLMLAKNELKVTPSLIIAALILRIRKPLEDIFIFKNTGYGLRGHVDASSESFTFVGS